MSQTVSQRLAFDSGVLILFLNDALPEPSVSLLAESLQTGRALVTANGKDFRRVPGLILLEV